MRLGTRSRSLATVRQWAQRFASLYWVVCGWPGEALGSAEQQVRMRFDQLLGEFSSMTLTPHRLWASTSRSSSCCSSLRVAHCLRARQ
jgi:hypothetical protein